MTTSPRRTVRPGGLAARQELTALLANVWAAEAVRPGSLLVIAAPALADAPALDNRPGGFSGLEPGWGERVLRLSELALRVLAQGGDVWLLTLRQADGPNRFLSRVRERAVEGGLAARLRTAELAHLPAAGVFGDGYAVTGTIEFTDAGADFAGEVVVFDLSPPEPERLAVRSTFEGLLA